MLLTTKLFVPPLLEHHVPRPRLHARLAGVFNARLTLLSAPAGFGKSTLLAEWLGAMPQVAPTAACAWVSLDEHDNDAARFYTHVLTALHNADSLLGGDLQTFALLPQMPAGEVLMSALINDMARREQPLVLVLDDYHAIENPELHKALIFLVEHAPAHLHLVLATRANPPFPLARWRVRRALLEVREHDLRFHHDEIAGFLRHSTGAELSEAQIDAIEQRTEGWIGALQLAALSMQGTRDLRGFLARFTGSHSYIVDYLVEEVLSRQPQEVQRFLLQTSILERMCGDLCAAITGLDDSEAILLSLHQQNVFIIALDDEQHWSRYHRLFADMLRARLRRTAAADSAALHLAASRWCEAHGWLSEAVQYALAASDHQRTAQLIEHHYWQMLERSEFAQLASWIQNLPHELVRARPLLSLARAWSLYATYRFPEIEACLDDVESGWSGSEPDCGLQAEILTLRASSAMYAGRSERAIALAQQALAADAEHRALIFCTNAIALGYSYNVSGQPQRSYEWAKAGCERGIEARLPFPAAENQEIVLLYLERIGDFSEGEAIIRRVLAAANQGDALAVFLSTSAHLFLSRYLLERYELDAAAHHILIAQQQATRLGLAYVLIKCHIQLMFIRQAQGNWAEAHAHLAAMWELSVDFSGYYLEWHAALAAFACLLQGELDEAASFMNKVSFSPAHEVTAANEPEASVCARLLYAQGCLDAALDLADRLRAVHTALGRVRREMEMWCLRSLVLWQLGQAGEAIAALDAALAIGERYRLLYALLIMSEPLPVLLRTYGDQTPAPPHAEFARTLLALLDARMSQPLSAAPEPAAVTPVGAPLVDPLVERLSERELEVLRLVAQGLSDRQIAERLIVAAGTVKRHLNNLYGKLNVHSRTQALARAKEIGLLIE
jgi:LuxR family maltose regulon positive regulatory protein